MAFFFIFFFTYKELEHYQIEHQLPWTTSFSSAQDRSSGQFF